MCDAHPVLYLLQAARTPSLPDSTLDHCWGSHRVSADSLCKVAANCPPVGVPVGVRLMIASIPTCVRQCRSSAAGDNDNECGKSALRLRFCAGFPQQGLFYRYSANQSCVMVRSTRW
jgi:hypothetical protein